MPNLQKLESFAFTLLFVALGYALMALVPTSALYDLSMPETVAMFAAIAVAFVLAALRFLEKRRLALERLMYAAFLAGMPFIYLAAALKQGTQSGIAIELVGVPVFVGLAAFGYYKSFLVFGVGIIAHGVGWDLWHHAAATYIASWYPSACLLVDLAMGFLAITQCAAQQVPNKPLQPTAEKRGG